MRGLSTLLLMLSDVPTPKGLKVSAVGKADRDFVVDLEVENSGVLCLAQDGKEWAALASFIPQIAPKKSTLRSLCLT